MKDVFIDTPCKLYTISSSLFPTVAFCWSPRLAACVGISHLSYSLWGKEEGEAIRVGAAKGKKKCKENEQHNEESTYKTACRPKERRKRGNGNIKRKDRNNSTGNINNSTVYLQCMA